MRNESADVVIIGAGAAGLFAAAFAARTHPGRRVVVLDGARKLGAKILVSGGGRCNVTHDLVEPEAYAGSSRNAIKKVLRRFDVPQTIAFFRDLGIELKREETGKLFPVSDDAATVLDALLRAVRTAGAELLHPCRVNQITVAAPGFIVSGEWGRITAPRVILAAGGMSLPKSGSDGGGYKLAQALGHSLTERIFPALVPLVLPGHHFLRELSGVALRVRLDLKTASGKLLHSFTDSLLCTHFGLSGPVVLDMSRYYLDALQTDRSTQLLVNWLPDQSPALLEEQLMQPLRISVGRLLGEWLPERLVRALCAQAGVDPQPAVHQLSRDARRQLVRVLTALPLPVMDSRGFTYAEVTAGGVPLSEIRLETMESRICAGLYFCGEICDVDGRIGGYNFQWAWSSGYVAGISV